MNSGSVAPPAWQCRAMTVAYGDFIALDGIDVGFERGRIHAVVGQNGAGKTTFARAIAGIVRPRQGQILVDGLEIEPGKVRAARDAGVELVHQSFALPPSFTIAEAMEFGTRKHGQLFTASGLARRWTQHLAELDVTADVRSRIRDLPVETQQGVEIARALVTEADLLILDEPTAVLSPSGVERLFERVRRLKARGVTVILILHKIREVLAIADTVTVLRGGRLVAAGLARQALDPVALSDLIIGGPAAQGAEAAVGLAAGAPAEHAVARQTAAIEPIARLEDITTEGRAEAPALDHASVALHAGEILGVAGVEGNGQRSLVEALCGLAKLKEGRIMMGGRDISREDLGERRKQGLRVIPFERNSEGLSLSSALWENWAASRLLAGPLLSYIRPQRLRAQARAAFDRWSVRYAGPSQPAGALSGGNAQKVIFSRELDGQVRLIIAAQPTRGLDIGATAFVWKALREARDTGAAVLMISSDLDELFDTADRLIVMLSGRVVAEFRPPYDMARVGAAMTGAVTEALSEPLTGARP
ncbi:ABC transporter ATP-binding protein [Rhizobium rhizosphaerae]|uniref:ABC transporter ATP-binding protein n=1 Tax=Xaviernesmea rhizosphaerae TaxID=1672749 RepID=A0A1Q9AHS7_9HYPH|nr:ATP-binding cassette domain-containing protein [Xaviernesmea rhizosphaerae]OLP54777.1 ABC transporter ATP-binding protein [Xaviernesmea rhizosphaerae]